MAVESWRYGDPAKVLERQGEGCDNCKYLDTWHIADKTVEACAKGKKPGRRCDDWKHENWESGL